MKKNISINLFGTLYQIDEDAYNLLEQYLNSMQNYFSRQEGGDEIADDIEHRVAELLWQEKENGAEAVNISMIKDIIGKIGNPAQIDGAMDNTDGNADSNATEAASNFAESKGANDNNSRTYEQNYDKSESSFQQFRQNLHGKRLYRDLNGKMLGGVCTGLSNYIGGDVTLWRLGIVVLSICCWSLDINIFMGLINWFIPLSYLVLWFVVPVVHTPEDRLRMRGVEINPQNLNEEILKDTNVRTDSVYNTDTQHNNGGCLKLLGGGCLVMILFPFLIFIVMMMFAAPIFSGFVNSGMFESITDFNGSLAPMMQSLQGMLWAILACGFIVCLIPVFLLVRWLRGSSKPLTGSVIAIILVVWLAALISGVYFVSTRIADVAKIGIEISNSNNEYEDSEWDVDGIHYKDEAEWTWVRHNDWKILSNGCCNRVTSSGEYMIEGAEDGDGVVRYLDCCNYDEQMEYTAEKSEFVTEPGYYRLIAATRANSNGAYIFANVGASIADGECKLSPINAYQNTGGPLWEWASGMLTDVNGIVPEMNDETKQSIAAANVGQGYGWSYTVVDSILVSEGDHVYYGVTTADEYTNDYSNCGWFSATDFKLEKIGELK